DGRSKSQNGSGPAVVAAGPPGDEASELVSRRHQRHFILVELRNHLTIRWSSKYSGVAIRLSMPILLSMAIARGMTIRRMLFAFELLSFRGTFKRAGGGLSGRDNGCHCVEVPSPNEALMFYRAIGKALRQIKLSLLQLRIGCHPSSRVLASESLIWRSAL